MQEQDTDSRSFKGYSLFDDVQDISLRARNRAVVMANIIESNVNIRGIIKLSAAKDALEYFSKIPKEERTEVYSFLSNEMNSRGISLPV